MTNSQEKVLKQLRADVEKQLLLNENYEIKEWNVEENERFHFLIVSFETGLKDDEGTYAEIYGRDRGLVTIGTKGGLKCFNGKTLKNEPVRNVFEINIWHIVCAYKGI